MQRIYKLKREQVVKTDITTAWNFIRSPKNLEALTPKDLSFEIVTKVPERIYNGLLIELRVGVPIFGKQTWLTEIKYVREKHSFVDEQRSGPYKLWLHYHEVQEVEKGVRFIDQVHYMLPFGFLGTLAHKLFVRKMLGKVFAYREAKLSKLLER